MRAPLPLVVLSSLLMLAACGPTVDLTKGLEVVDLTTGWHDAGILPDGNNKIVPAVAFKVKNVSDQSLRALQVNVIFKRLNDEIEWDLPVADRDVQCAFGGGERAFVVAPNVGGLAEP